MKLFDTHTHLNADAFIGSEAEIVANALANQVAYMLVVGFDAPTIERTLTLNKQFPSVISAVGIHPTEAGNYSEEVEAYLRKALADERVYLLGEIGLDYYWDTAPKSIQAEVFIRQIQLAKELDLPIAIHNRDATEDVYQILKSEGIPVRGCIMHSFGEGPDWAEKFLDLGCHLSFSGVVTFKKTDQVREACAITPADRLLIETDAPYLAPVPMRGKRNEPAYVRYVAETVAQVRGLSLEEVAYLTTVNACQLLQFFPTGWDKP